MRVVVGILIIGVVVAGIVVLYDVGKKASSDSIIPKQALSEAKRAEIRSALQDLSDAEKSARGVVRRFGKDATPVIIERVQEIYEKGSDWEYQRLYAQAEDLIVSLGEAGDARAKDALELWVADKDYRVFRDEAAQALGKLGDRSSRQALWQAWNEEKGYLLEGDDEGPWPFAGEPPAGGYVHSMLADIGKALHELGDDEVIGELIEVGSLSEGRWEAGKMKIIDALSDISGKALEPEMLGMKYWEKWWQDNQASYLDNKQEPVQ